jgi:hypothetical protein
MKFSSFVSYIFVSFLCISLSSAFGQHNYYISSVHGNDANSGTSESSPWKSLSKLQQVLPNLVAGDVILLERGSIWHETDLKIYNRSGSASNPIIFKAYGTGPRPVLSGSKVLQSFSRSGNIYAASVYKDFLNAPMNVPAGILINGEWMDIARSEEHLVYGSNSATYISDPSANWSSNKYTGALCIIQPVHWHWTPSPITSNTSNGISFQQVQHASSSDKVVAFYIANHDDFLKSNGDWTFRDRTLKIFYNGDLTNQNVQFAVSDTILSLRYCSNYEFRDIVFEMANFRHLSVYEGSNFKISGCEFRYTAGESIKIYDLNELQFTENYVHDCGAVGLRINYFGYARIEHNLFRRIAATHVGMANYDFRMGAAITVNYSTSPSFDIRYNYFDSVGLAIQSHTFRSDGSANISYNYIENYGVTISDCGALYFNSDMGTEVQRNVKNNIIRNAVSAGTRYPTNYHPVLHPHAIYLDEGALAYNCDSNTIENTSFALYMNRNFKNSFKHANIVNANQNNPAFYNAVFMKDQAIGLLNMSADRDTIKYNNIVLGEGNTPRVYLRHESEESHDAYVDNNLFYLDYNRVANPFNSGETDFGRYILNWNHADYNYSLEQMRSGSSLVSFMSTDNNSTLNQQGISYSGVSGSVSKENFVRLYTNFSRTPRNVNLGNVSFRDMEGKVVSGTIVIPPFYSRILFYQSGNLSTAAPEHYMDSTLIPALIMDEDGYINNPPIINDIEFTVNETSPQPSYIGNIAVTDPDDLQGHTFAIVSGNTNNLFTISHSGSLSFLSQSIDFTNNPVYSLNVRVTDNGIPPLSDDALVIVRLLKSSLNEAPLMENQRFEFYEASDTSLLVGSVIAYDPDQDDLSFLVVSGDDDHFTVDENSGEIYISDIKLDYSVPTTFDFIVRVTDNGSPKLSDEATISIVYIPADYTVFIDPSASTGGNGTFSYPLNSLVGISFLPKYTYLVKRGTVSTIESIQIDANDVAIGSYGSGELPVITSSSYDHIIRIPDRKNIVLRDLEIRANSALSGIYILGPESENILIENCKVEGPEYGLRCINTGSIITKYCRFFSNLHAAYIIGSSSHFYYNVFSDNTYGLNINSLQNQSDIFNNVFYNNRYAITYTGSQLNLNNNILFLSDVGDKALEVNSGSMQADHNIFYPEREGFYSLANYTYNSLEDVRQFEQMETNSFVSDPNFIDPEEDNFYPEVFSPAIDAGMYVGLQYDINGVPIPYGHAPDIGIIEYAGPDNLENFSKDALIPDFWAYPNPAVDQVSIMARTEVSGEKTIQVCDLFGRLIEERTGILGSGDERICTLDIGSYEPGLYLVNILDGRIIGSVKIIKAY